LAQPVSVAYWVKPLLIGYSACWADGLMALANLGSTPDLEGGFSALLVLRACYEIKFSVRYRGFACVLYKLHSVIRALEW